MHMHIANATIHVTLASAGEVTQQLREFAVDTSEPTVAPPAAGEYWPGQGGYFICTQPALLGLPARHLVFGKDEVEDLTFGPREEIADTSSQIDGAGNTARLIGSAHKHPAAQWAAAYQADGHDDFHLPSRLDLLMAYVCAPQLFQKSGWYWSSTQVSRFIAFVQDFEYGDSGWLVKGVECRVRACRWVHLNA